MRLARPASIVIASLLLATALAGCATTVSLDPAEGANDPLCADVMVRLPGSVDGQERHWTNAQSTAAWGEPTTVILTCGVDTPGPTEARCITIGGVDWIVDESEAPKYRITTYGRTPAVQVYLDNEVVSSNDVLDRLGTLISGTIPAQNECVAADEVLPDGES